MLIKPLLLFVGLVAAAPKPQPQAARPPAYTVSSLGCYVDPLNILDPAIPSNFTSVIVLNSVEACGAFCNGLSYSLFGLENGEQCFCGNTVVSPTAPPILGVSQCSVPCPGALTETCGGVTRLNVYRIVAAATTTTTTATTSAASSIGTTSSSSSFTTTSVASSTGTTSLSSSFTTTSVASSIGTTSSSSSFTTTSSVSLSTTPTVLTTTSTTGTALPSISATPLGCYTDDENVLNPALRGAVEVIVLNSIEVCGNFCKNLGYPLFGVEDGDECFCGNTVNSTTAPPILGVSQCLTPCPGDLTENCGGVNRINVFAISGATASSTSSSSFVTVSTSTATSTATSTSTTSFAPGTTSTSLSTSSTSTSASSSSSTSISASSTLGASTSVTSTSSSRISTSASSSTLSRTSTSSSTGSSTTGTTTMSSSGTSSGGTSTGTSTSSSTTTQPTTVIVGADFTYVGCYLDMTSSGAILRRQSTAYGMTVESCAAACIGNLYFGVENGNECYCGNTISSSPAPGGSDPAQNGCNIACTQNSQEFCGGFERLAIYRLTAGVKSTATSSTTFQLSSSTSSRGSSSTSSGTTSQSTSSSSIRVSPTLTTAGGSSSSTSSTSTWSTSYTSHSTTVYASSSNTWKSSSTGQMTSTSNSPTSTNVVDPGSTSTSTITRTSTTTTTTTITDPPKTITVTGSSPTLTVTITVTIGTTTKMSTITRTATSTQFGRPTVCPRFVPEWGWGWGMRRPHPGHPVWKPVTVTKIATEVVLETFYIGGGFHTRTVNPNAWWTATATVSTTATATATKTITLTSISFFTPACTHAGRPPF